MCKFDIAWVGKCKDQPNDDLCNKHLGMKCCSCGEQATGECGETSQFVCGAPLCDDCEHTIESNGCNSGGTRPEGLRGHCKKTDQVYKPWYMRTDIEDKIIKNIGKNRELIERTLESDLEPILIKDIIQRLSDKNDKLLDELKNIGQN